MNKQILKLLVIGSVCVAANNAAAGQANGLTTFTAGTPAVAAEVNANFGAVAAAINDNDARVTSNASAIAANTAAIATVTGDALQALDRKLDISASVDTAACASAPVQCTQSGVHTAQAATSANHNPVGLTLLVGKHGSPVLNLDLNTFQIATAFVPAGGSAAVTCSEANCGPQRFQGASSGAYHIFLDRFAAGNWKAGTYQLVVRVSFNDAGVPRQGVALVPFTIPVGP